MPLKSGDQTTRRTPLATLSKSPTYWLSWGGFVASLVCFLGFFTANLLF